LDKAVEIRINIRVDWSQANLKLLLDNVLNLGANLSAGNWDFRGSLDSLWQIAH
jgi:hypothetical protein